MRRPQKRGDVLDEPVAGDRREGDEGGHDARDPGGVAAEQIEEVRRPGVQPPDQERALERRHDHQEPQRPCPPAELPAGVEHLAHLGGELGHRRGAGREADVVHQRRPDGEHDREQPGAHDERPGEVHAAEQAATDRSEDHRGPGHDRAAGEDPVELPVVAGRPERVDQPGLDRAGIEAEPQPEHERRQHERDQAATGRGDRDVQRGCRAPGPRRSAGTTAGARSCRRRRLSGSRTAPSRRCRRR